MDLSQCLDTISHIKPIIHVISNDVTRNFIADGLAALGCRPVMASAIEELDDVISKSHGLVINTGTPSHEKSKTYRSALRGALDHSCPVVLDFPGLGISSFRRTTALELLKVIDLAKPTGRSFDFPICFRGNATEVIQLSRDLATSQLSVEIPGSSIDSIHSPEQASKEIDPLLQYFSEIHISGAENIIITRKNKLSTLSRVQGGHYFMQKSSGFGCLNSAIDAAFLALTKVSQITAHEALTAANQLMYEAAKKVSNPVGPGSFKISFLDQLHAITIENKHTTLGALHETK